MPSKSAKQHRLMEAVAHNPDFADKVGIPQSVGKDFVEADKRDDCSLSRIDELIKKANTRLHNIVVRSDITIPDPAQHEPSMQPKGMAHDLTSVIRNTQTGEDYTDPSDPYTSHFFFNQRARDERGWSGEHMEYGYKTNSGRYFKHNDFALKQHIIEHNIIPDIYHHTLLRERSIDASYLANPHTYFQHDARLPTQYHSSTPSLTAVSIHNALGGPGERARTSYHVAPIGDTNHEHLPRPTTSNTDVAHAFATHEGHIHSRTSLVLRDYVTRHNLIPPEYHEDLNSDRNEFLPLSHEHLANPSEHFRTSAQLHEHDLRPATHNPATGETTVHELRNESWGDLFRRTGTLGYVHMNGHQHGYQFPNGEFRAANHPDVFGHIIQHDLIPSEYHHSLQEQGAVHPRHLANPAYHLESDSQREEREQREREQEDEDAGWEEHEKSNTFHQPEDIGKDVAISKHANNRESGRNFTYRVHVKGEPVAELDLEKEYGDTGRAMLNVMPLDKEGNTTTYTNTTNSNRFGAGAVKQVLKHLHQLHPDIREMGGNRVTGARTGKNMVGGVRFTRKDSEILFRSIRMDSDEILYFIPDNF
jgi:hypothetical protein